METPEVKKIDEQKKMRININTKDVPEKRKRFKIRNKKTKAIVKERHWGKKGIFEDMEEIENTKDNYWTRMYKTIRKQLRIKPKNWNHGWWRRSR